MSVGRVDQAQQGRGHDVLERGLAAAGRALDWVMDLLGGRPAPPVRARSPGRSRPPRRSARRRGRPAPNVLAWREVRDSVRTLAAALRDEDPEVRAAAGRALARLGQVEAVSRGPRGDRTVAQVGAREPDAVSSAGSQGRMTPLRTG